MAKSLYGWTIRIRRALCVTTVATILYVVLNTMDFIMMATDRKHYGSMLNFLIYYVFTYLAGLTAGLFNFVVSNPKPWAKTIGPFMVRYPRNN